MLLKVVLDDIAGVNISTNEYLGAFEADIVVRKGSEIIVNIELDGPRHHYRLRTQRFTGIRDRFLRDEMGVEVLRWDTSTDNSTDEQIIITFRNLFQNLLATEKPFPR